MLCLHGIEDNIILEVGRYGIGAGIVSYASVECIVHSVLGDDGSDIAHVRTPCLLVGVGHFVAEHHEHLQRSLVGDELLYVLNILSHHKCPEVGALVCRIFLYLLCGLRQNQCLKLVEIAEHISIHTVVFLHIVVGTPVVVYMVALLDVRLIEVEVSQTTGGVNLAVVHIAASHVAQQSDVLAVDRAIDTQ